MLFIWSHQSKIGNHLGPYIIARPGKEPPQGCPSSGLVGDLLDQPKIPLRSGRRSGLQGSWLRVSGLQDLVTGLTFQHAVLVHLFHWLGFPEHDVTLGPNFRWVVPSTRRSATVGSTSSVPC